MKSHGQYAFRTLGRILIVDATGPFNLETVRERREDLRASIESLAPGPWALLVVFHEISLFTPEAEAELVQVTQWRKSMGMNVIAIVLDDARAPSILKDQMERIYSVANVEHAYFASFDQAQSWLDSLDYGA